jgi:hypothetical protein
LLSTLLGGGAVSDMERAHLDNEAYKTEALGLKGSYTAARAEALVSGKPWDADGVELAAAADVLLAALAGSEPSRQAWIVSAESAWAVAAPIASESAAAGRDRQWQERLGASYAKKRRPPSGQSRRFKIVAGAVGRDSTKPAP